MDKKVIFVSRNVQFVKNTFPFHISDQHDSFSPIYTPVVPTNFVPHVIQDVSPSVTSKVDIGDPLIHMDASPEIHNSHEDHILNA